VTRIGVPAFTMIAIVGARDFRPKRKRRARNICDLRNAANEAWKQAMRVSPPERCGALYHASLAAEATPQTTQMTIASSCDISVPLLNQVEGYHREAVQARDNACAGTPSSTISCRYHPTLRSQETWSSSPNFGN